MNTEKVKEKGETFMEKMKKAFTLTELVIVIAVIAILAAVLIPTYTSLVKKANISADTQLAKTMNNLISEETTMTGVINTLAEAGYSVGKLNPTTEGHRFLWDSKTKQIIFVDSKYNIVYKAKDINLDEADLWLTVKQPKEVVTSKKYVLNYYLTQDSSKNFSLSTISDFDTGTSVLSGNLSIDSDGTGEAVLKGTFLGTTTIDTPNADVVQYGTMENLNVTAVADESLTVNGFIGAMEMGDGHVEFESSAYVNTLTVKSNDAVIENAGIIETFAKDAEVTTVNFANNGGMVATDDSGELSASQTTTPNYALQIGSTTALEGFRDAVNGGATFDDMTVELTANIELNDGWTPIGAFARDDKADSAVKGFQGTFDGKGFTISNLNNDGYNPQSVALGKNSSSIKDRKEYVYGLFGYISSNDTQNPVTIKNLNLTRVNIDVNTGASVYGDSVGALVGYIWNGATISNITVGTETDNSKVIAYDGVAGIVGRAYGQGALAVTDSENFAAVKGGEKVGGLVGVVSKKTAATISYSDNNGTVTVIAQGLVKNASGQARTAGYAAGLIGFVGSNSTATFSNCASNGNVTVDIPVATWTVYMDAYAYMQPSGTTTRHYTATDCTADADLIKKVNGTEVAE